jgi:hypothetical protein
MVAPWFGHECATLVPRLRDAYLKVVVAMLLHDAVSFNALGIILQVIVWPCPKLGLNKTPRVLRKEQTFVPDARGDLISLPQKLNLSTPI